MISFSSQPFSYISNREGVPSMKYHYDQPFFDSNIPLNRSEVYSHGFMPSTNNIEPPFYVVPESNVEVKIKSYSWFWILIFILIFGLFYFIWKDKIDRFILKVFKKIEKSFFFGSYKNGNSSLRNKNDCLNYV